VGVPQGSSSIGAPGGITKLVPKGESRKGGSQGVFPPGVTWRVSRGVPRVAPGVPWCVPRWGTPGVVPPVGFHPCGTICVVPKGRSQGVFPRWVHQGWSPTGVPQGGSQRGTPGTVRHGRNRRGVPKVGFPLGVIEGGPPRWSCKGSPCGSQNGVFPRGVPEGVPTGWVSMGGPPVGVPMWEPTGGV
jgi:hypothetical protein